MFRDSNEEVADLSEVVLLNDETSDMIGNPLDDDNSWYTPMRDATVGFASGLGGLLSGPSALRISDHPMFLPGMAIVTTVGATFTTIIGSSRDGVRNFKASDFVKYGAVSTATILTTAGTWTGGAAVITAVNTTNLGVVAGISIGTGVAGLVAPMVAGLLVGFGLFKARECIKPAVAENYDETIRPSLVINS